MRELRQMAQLGRQPFELIVVDLKHDAGQITTQPIRISHGEPLKPRQLADFCRERRELVVADLNACGARSDNDPLPRVPHVEPLEIGQQTELGRKRREVVAFDLKTT